ncbi:MAG: hypothetical protein JXJ04_10780 [Spirochaetales bacterium]|nr:hypothetical protein [Spirochaetales bacterium]
MGKILLDIPQIPDSFIRAENMDEAIEKLKELKTGTHKEALDVLIKFKGMMKDSVDFPEDDWYKQ